MNDHYHRPKRKIVQKGMEATGDNPEECFSQSELDKYSELECVRCAFRAMGLDPQNLDLRICEQDPPDCQSFDVSGNLVGWEVTGLYDQEVEEPNAAVGVQGCSAWTIDELEGRLSSRKCRELLGRYIFGLEETE